MNKKKIGTICGIVVAISTLVLFGMKLGLIGSNIGLSTMEKIQKQLIEMESYQSDVTLRRISNKGETRYETRQSYKTSGEYRLEITAPDNIAGNYTVFDGNTICQYNPNVDGKVIMDVPESPYRNELFLGQFVKNYMQSENVSVEASNMEGGTVTVLEAVIPGNNEFLATEKLWVDNETLKPVQLIIYDKNGLERYILNYNNFEYNVDFTEDTFVIPQ